MLPPAGDLAPKFLCALCGHAAILPAPWVLIGGAGGPSGDGGTAEREREEPSHEPVTYIPCWLQVNPRVVAPPSGGVENSLHLAFALRSRALSSSRHSGTKAIIPSVSTTAQLLGWEVGGALPRRQVIEPDHRIEQQPGPSASVMKVSGVSSISGPVTGRWGSLIPKFK